MVMKTMVRLAPVCGLCAVAVGYIWNAPSYESEEINGHSSGDEAASFASVPCGPFFQSPSILDPLSGGVTMGLGW